MAKIIEFSEAKNRFISREQEELSLENIATKLLGSNSKEDVDRVRKGLELMLKKYQEELSLGNIAIKLLGSNSKENVKRVRKGLEVMLEKYQGDKNLMENR